MTDSTPNRDAIRAEIEETKTAFHALLDSLSDEDWKKKSANPSWSVGQLMWHLGYGMEFFPRIVENCGKGRGPSAPSWIVGPANVLLTRLGSRGARPESVAGKYDAAHDALLACLDTVQDDEWGKSARVYGNENTIASTFAQPAEHFREHGADILRGLGRQ